MHKRVHYDDAADGSDAGKNTYGYWSRTRAGNEHSSHTLNSQWSV